jgi:hypothetical protein
MVAFFAQMAQLHPENNYMMVLKSETTDPVIVTTKVQARNRDPMTL